MPEGDTIFRAAHTLHRALAGELVTGFEAAYAPLASVHDQTPVTGRTIERIESRGKWLLFHFSGDLILVTHMLMSGSWHIYRPGERWKKPRSHMRVALETRNWHAVAFDVPVARFHTARSLERHTAIPALGPDLLDKGFLRDEAARRLVARVDEEIGNVLLDQRVIAGIGNVFKSEICFASGVFPFRKVSTLKTEEVDRLLDTARKFLAANAGPDSADSIVTYTGGRRTTGSENQSARLWVYRRKGQPCRRCGTAIQMRKQGSGARSTYWCPLCQSDEIKND
jgi:endonuclease VIII